MKKKNALPSFLKSRSSILFILYIFIAGFATVVDVSLLFILTEFAHIHYFFSAIMSYIAGMLTNFTLNKKYNFKDKNKKILQQFSIFTIVALVGLALNQFILLLLVEFADMWYMFAKAISIFIVMFWSFFAHKKFTFTQVGRK